MTNHIHPDDRRMVLVWLLVCLAIIALFCSCSPSKKAHEYFSGHSEEFAKGCADAFPVKETTDTKAYDSSKAKIDSIIAANEGDKMINDQLRQDLVDEIDRLKSKPDSHTDENCDSTQEAIYRLAAKERQRADAYEKKYNNLADAAKNVKPVEHFTENTARVEAYRQDVAKLTSALANAAIKNSELTEQVNDWKAKAHKYFWIIVAIIAARDVIKFRKPIFNLIKSFV
jgi:hypothetical protein